MILRLATQTKMLDFQHTTFGQYVEQFACDVSPCIFNNSIGRRKEEEEEEEEEEDTPTIAINANDPSEEFTGAS